MGFPNRKRIWMVPLALVIFLAGMAGAGLAVKNHVQSQVKDLFRMNGVLQSQGYYMGDFEFKMLGMAYWLDRGHYYTALSQLSRFHRELTAKTNLVKVPMFDSKADEFSFYLSLQNPRTGAFMDDSFPFCTYNEVTENVLEHLAALAKATGQPLRLRYPLKYLDAIDAPETLRAFLDDVSTVGWIGSLFPQTPFVFARSLLDRLNGEGIMEANNLHCFSAEWKQALNQWFYDNQDPETGFWGPRSRFTGKLLRKDLTNTASIIKTFVDADGNDRNASFPLRHRREMFRTSLDVLSEPMPEEGRLEEWHEWSLKMGKGISMLTRYLWQDASPEERTRAKALIEEFVKVSFDKYYVQTEGAFSHYPNSEHATLDGTGGKLGDLADVGFFTGKTQQRLWGDAESTMADCGERVVSALAATDLDAVKNVPGVNSIRLYPAFPEDDDYTRDVLAVYYPRATSVLDAMELLPRIREWANATPQNMGNWVSRERVVEKLESLNAHAVPVYREGASMEDASDLLHKDSRLFAVGFDILQSPLCKMTLIVP